MERVKRVLGIGVFASLFLSMFISFVVTLSNNVNIVDTTIAYCPQSHQEVIILDQDEQDLDQEHKILIEKNVIAGECTLPRYDVIKHVMLTPEEPHFYELQNDIFYPPKSLTV